MVGTEDSNSKHLPCRSFFLQYLTPPLGPPKPLETRVIDWGTPEMMRANLAGILQ